MGYRSDVVIQVEFYKAEQTLEKTEELLKICEPDEMNIYEEKDYSIGVPIHRLVAKFNFRKWYSEYQEVKAINNLIRELGNTAEDLEDNNILSVQFFRVGEDYSDIETIEYGYPNKPLSVERYIEIQL
jgi:hypothetical protein